MNWLVKLVKYYNKSLDADVLGIYKDALSDIDDDVIDQAATEHIRTSRWFPKVSELREIAERIMGDNLDDVVGKSILLAEAGLPEIKPISVMFIDGDVLETEVIGGQHVPKKEQPQWEKWRRELLPQEVN